MTCLCTHVKGLLSVRIASANIHSIITQEIMFILSVICFCFFIVLYSSYSYCKSIFSDRTHLLALKQTKDVCCVWLFGLFMFLLML